MASTQAPQIALDRVEALRQAHNGHDVDKIMTFFVEDGLDYSDYGVNALHQPASAVRKIFAGLYECITDSVITTRNVYGTEDFVAWELEWEGKYIKEFPTMPKADGQTLRLVGVSLQWWNADGRVWKECDYVTMKLIGADGKEQKFH